MTIEGYPTTSRRAEDETARLAELESYDILDTVPEAAYDAITRLAAQICGAPIALISIIDKERQWFKSRVGLDVTETPRDQAFCAHAILEPDRMMVVPDATHDRRFATNPLVTDDPSIRFYAGMPLATHTGTALGTLCVIDRIPRSLSPEQEQALQALAVQVMALLELRLTVGELRRKQKELAEVMAQRELLLATVSHEIRTPLSAVIGYVEILSEGGAGVSDEMRADMLATIGREAGDVLNLIEDLLVVARAEAGSLKVSRVGVNLRAQVAQVLEGMDPSTAGMVTIETEPANASGDPSRVRQVIRNLITNALRYGGPDVTIRTRTFADRCHMLVLDNGEGIPENERELVFDNYGRGSNATRVAGSVGLGLPISRLLAQEMGGSLTYRYEAGQSIFDLDLPAAE